MEINRKDVISLDVPLLIRLLEYAREDAKSDMDLHRVAENLIYLSQTSNTLSMDDYNNIVNIDTENIDEVKNLQRRANIIK